MIPAWLSWKAAKAIAGKVPRGVWQVAGLVVVILLARWYWIGVGEDREAARWVDKQRTANELQAKAEAKRDTKAAAIATDSHKEAAKTVATTQGKTDEREARIAAAPVSGGCRFPDGLPDLAPAVEAANAARRPTVP